MDGWMLPIYREGLTDPFFNTPSSSMMQPWGFGSQQWPMAHPPPPFMPHPNQMMRQMSDTMRNMEHQMQSMERLFPYFRPGEFRPDSVPSQLAPVEDKDTYKIQIQATEYQPNEITVKTVDRDGKKFLVAEGKHETRDADGYHSVHHFKRQYMVPDNVKVEDFTSRLTTDGTLTIQAPKIPNKPAIKDTSKNIPIQQ